METRNHVEFAATTADGRDRKQLERICRPPFAHDAVTALSLRRRVTPRPAAVLAAPLGHLAADFVTSTLPLAPWTVPKSSDRGLPRCSPDRPVLTLAPKFPHRTPLSATAALLLQLISQARRGPRHVWKRLLAEPSQLR